MQKEIIVIIGGPGTGKSSIINGLVAKGYCCYPEISREVTLEAQKRGIEQLFLEDPLLFSQMLLDGRITLAVLLAQRGWRLVPQQGTAGTLTFFHRRVLFLQRLDEQGVVGFVQAELFGEFHGVGKGEEPRYFTPPAARLEIITPAAR